MAKRYKIALIISIPGIIFGLWLRNGLWGMLLDRFIIPSYPYKLIIFLFFPVSLALASLGTIILLLTSKAAIVKKVGGVFLSCLVLVLAGKIFHSSTITLNHSFSAYPVKKVLVDPRNPKSYIAETVNKGNGQVFIEHSQVYWNKWGFRKIRPIHLDSIKGNWYVIGPDGTRAGKVFIDTDRTRRYEVNDSIGFGALPQSDDLIVNQRTWFRTEIIGGKDRMINQCDDTLGMVTLTFKTNFVGTQYDLTYRTRGFSQTWKIREISQKGNRIFFTPETGEEESIFFQYFPKIGVTVWELPVENGGFFSIASELSWLHPWHHEGCNETETQTDTANLDYLPPIISINDIWNYIDNIRYHANGEGYRYMSGYYSIGTAILKAFPLDKIMDTYNISIFRKGPHKKGQMDLKNKNDFGRYNPKFIKWATEAFVPGPASNLQKHYQPIYEKNFRPLARGFFLVRKKFNEHPHCRDSLLSRVQKSLKNPKNNSFYQENYDLIDFLSEKFCESNYNAHDELELDDNNIIGIVGFWLRRELDNTAPEFEKALVEVLTVFDPDFLEVYDDPNEYANIDTSETY